MNRTGLTPIEDVHRYRSLFSFCKEENALGANRTRDKPSQRVAQSAILLIQLIGRQVATARQRLLVNDK
jgi:hypothetical protein